jgi:hypothetical protein
LTVTIAAPEGKPSGTMVFVLVPTRLLLPIDLRLHFFVLRKLMLTLADPSRGSGEPVPLPPPACLTPPALRSDWLAIEPSNRGDFNFELWTPGRQHRLIILHRARLSPNLWTPPDWYGSQNSNALSYLICLRTVIEAFLSDIRKSGLRAGPGSKHARVRQSHLKVIGSNPIPATKL